MVHWSKISLCCSVWLLFQAGSYDSRDLYSHLNIQWSLFPLIEASTPSVCLLYFWISKLSNKRVSTSRLTVLLAPSPSVTSWVQHFRLSVVKFATLNLTLPLLFPDCLSLCVFWNRLGTRLISFDYLLFIINVKRPVQLWWRYVSEYWVLLF